MLFVSLRSSALNDHISAQATAEMDWCGVVGPRGPRRPLDEKKGFPTNISPLDEKCTFYEKNLSPQTRLDLARNGSILQGRTGALAAPVPGVCDFGAPRPPGGYPPVPQDEPKHIDGRGFGIYLYCPTAERSFAGRRHYSPLLPGGFTLPHRSDATLGRGLRSKPRTPI